MKKRITFIIVALIMLLIILFISQKKNEIWEVNEDLLKEEVLSINQALKTVNLADITPFEWDIAYSFDPYTSKDQIYETVGYKWDDIVETVNEGMNQIVFMKDSKVVCYLYGYPENNGYGIYFTSKNGKGEASASVLNIDDDLTLQVERNKKFIYLTNN